MRKIICFHDPDGINGYLSNWYPSVFEKDGVWYSCMEQYMMHQKAVVFHDGEIAEQILAADSPGKIKALGRKVRNFDETLWNGLRQILIYEGLLEKFRQNAGLKKQLLDTFPCILAECAVQDTIWGIGLSMTDPRRSDMTQWRGQNLLGFALMCARDSLNWMPAAFYPNAPDSLKR